MGKSYDKELASLPDTYEWARTVDVRRLERFVEAAQSRPLLAVGSGGSASAAHLASLLHRFSFGAFARHATPLDVLLCEPNLRNYAVLLLSASGRNGDVLAALEHSVHHEARIIATLCLQLGSPLAARVSSVERSFAWEDEGPAGSDGFLATNSLLATYTLLARAYKANLPEWKRLADGKNPPIDLGRKRTFLILHGGWGSPVATDLESRLNESAIASAQLSDYRNFGHGRHLWLARRGPETVVTMITTPETLSIAERTRALLPPELPVVELRTRFDRAAGCIDLLVQGLRLVGTLGRSQKFDPGRPNVPGFGRRLYHLAPPSLSVEEMAPVERKLAHGRYLERAQVVTAFESFVERLCAARIRGIVLDYDGTLCAQEERFDPLRSEIVHELRRLLEANLVIGIATGRGRSVRESLQNSLPQTLWSNVIVGYYNGGELAPLFRDDTPSRDSTPAPPLDAARDLLEKDTLLQSLALFTVRRRQITVEPKRSIPTDVLQSYVMLALCSLEDLGVRVFSSTHSVDILAPAVGKLAVVEEVKHRLKSDGDVLCIGDRGAWPGNDCTLLSHDLSLSVDEVSASLTTCWNIAPPGVSGPAAALQYFRSLHVLNGEATLEAHDLWRPR